MTLLCANSKLPYHYTGTTRDIVWQQWDIDARKRFSEYLTKLLSDKKINFKTVELKLALALSLFWANTIEEACEAMYAFGYPLTYIPKKFFTATDDILYACYRTLRYTYVIHSSLDSDNEMCREKKRVERLKTSLDYISDPQNGEQDLYAYFFGKCPLK